MNNKQGTEISAASLQEEKESTPDDTIPSNRKKPVRSIL